MAQPLRQRGAQLVEIVRREPAPERDQGRHGHQNIRQHCRLMSLRGSPSQGDYGTQELMERAVLQAARDHANETSDHGQKGKDHEGRQHDRRRFMDVMCGMLVDARRAIEREVQKPGHVKRR